MSLCEFDLKFDNLYDDILRLFVIETKMNFDQTLFCFRSMFALRLEFTIDSTSYNVQQGKKGRIFKKKMKKEKRRENENGHFRANEKK